MFNKPMFSFKKSRKRFLSFVKLPKLSKVELLMNLKGELKEFL